MTDAVLFDIDGTLVDSNYLHIEAWARAFDAVGAAVNSWRIHRGIGMDSAKLLEELLDGRPEDASIAKELHDQHYSSMADRLRPFDGARAIGAELSSRGFTVVLATSAPEDELDDLRRVLDIEDSISVVTSSEDVETAKPAPDIVQVALERAEVDASAAIMIGDSVWDVKAAMRAGVRCIGVLSGGISEAELRDAGAIAVYPDVAALLAALDDSPIVDQNSAGGSSS
jgi:HAD superfamily hydrolase (TIGR01509 family)